MANDRFRRFRMLTPKNPEANIKCYVNVELKCKQFCKSILVDKSLCAVKVFGLMVKKCWLSSKEGTTAYIHIWQISKCEITVWNIKWFLKLTCKNICFFRLCQVQEVMWEREKKDVFIGKYFKEEQHKQ